MDELIKYLKDTLGLNIQVYPFTSNQNGRLPFYMSNMYRLYNANVFSRALIFAELPDPNNLNIQQIDNHFQSLNAALGIPIVLIAQTIHPFIRKRLIERGINFIVPGYQMFLPAILIDFKENYAKPKIKKKYLVPSAQSILIYHILHRNENFENKPLKEIARMFNYTSMAITKAVNNLYQHDLCLIKGNKEKYIFFKVDIPELWHNALPYLTNPVLKKVFVEEKPQKAVLLSNTSALPEYTDMNPSRQLYYAIDRGNYFNLLKEGKLLNHNEFEGRYCLEVWKYNPLFLVEKLNNDLGVVDPLSLYLSLKDSKDERTDFALETLIGKNIW